MGILTKLFGKSKKQKISEALAAGAIIVDVRTRQEYRNGSIPGSVNIPLDQLSGSVKKLKKSGKPVITCCKSGMRSSMAVGTLSAEGIEAVNGGSWRSLMQYV